MNRLALGLMLCSTILVAQEIQSPPHSPANEPPMPDLKSLLDRAKANSDKWSELSKSYTCKQVVVEDDIDSKGNKKGTHSDEYQVFFVNKVELHQHLAHDGKPLTDADAKKEQERIDKEIAEIKSNTLKKKGGGIVFHFSSLLKVTNVSQPMRVMFNGRPTIHFDFSGNSSAKADGIAEDALKLLDGSVWIDEQDAAPVRFEGHLKENFHVAGGLLVNVKSGSHIVWEYKHVNNEVWFTSHLAVHGDGRILLFKGFDFNSDITFSDYRKMKTTVTLEPGSQVIDDNGKPIPNLEVEPPGVPAPPAASTGTPLPPAPKP
jgi:hypothetical protein